MYTFFFLKIEAYRLENLNNICDHASAWKAEGQEGRERREEDGGRKRG